MPSLNYKEELQSSSLEYLSTLRTLNDKMGPITLPKEIATNQIPPCYNFHIFERQIIANLRTENQDLEAKLLHLKNEFQEVERKLTEYKDIIEKLSKDNKTEEQSQESIIMRIKNRELEGISAKYNALREFYKKEADNYRKDIAALEEEVTDLKADIVLSKLKESQTKAYEQSQEIYNSNESKEITTIELYKNIAEFNEKKVKILEAENRKLQKEKEELFELNKNLLERKNLQTQTTASSAAEKPISNKKQKKKEMSNGNKSTIENVTEATGNGLKLDDSKEALSNLRIQEMTGLNNNTNRTKENSKSTTTKRKEKTKQGQHIFSTKASNSQKDNIVPNERDSIAKAFLSKKEKFHKELKGTQAETITDLKAIEGIEENNARDSISNALSKTSSKRTSCSLSSSKLEVFKPNNVEINTEEYVARKIRKKNVFGTTIVNIGTELLEDIEQNELQNSTLLMRLSKTDIGYYYQTKNFSINNSLNTTLIKKEDNLFDKSTAAKVAEDIPDFISGEYILSSFPKTYNPVEEVKVNTKYEKRNTKSLNTLKQKRAYSEIGYQSKRMYGDANNLLTLPKI